MKKASLLAISLAAMGAVSQAGAADLGRGPVYKAPPITAPAWSWTGFYIGVNAGGSISRNPTTQSITGGGLPGSQTLASFNMSPAGFIGGGQIGYNFQWAPNWVFGLEADFQGSTQKDSACDLVCAVATTQKLDWFGTGRARLGYTNGDWMYYVTGGAAWGRIRQDFSYTPVGLPTVGAVSSTRTKGGWTVGGGVETHLWSGWTAKAEYLYMDLGSISDTFAIPPSGTFSTTSKFRDHIIRAGLNYKF